MTNEIRVSYFFIAEPLICFSQIRLINFNFLLNFSMKLDMDSFHELTSVVTLDQYWLY